MPNYREKLREVEAKCFDGTEDEMLQVVDWIKSLGYTWFDMFTPAPTKGVSIERRTGFLMIVDVEGNLATAQKGDWIINDPTGRVYPMKPANFDATFEQIS